MTGGQKMETPARREPQPGRERAVNEKAAGIRNVAHDAAFANLAVAQELARQGIPVFPCNWDKTPLCRWKEAATSDAGAVRELWRQHPGALVGLPCGQRSGLFALDADVDKETGAPIGEQSLGALGLSHLLTDARQPRVRTPSGGLHLLFAHPGPGFKNSVGRLGPGLDVRTEGGYVVAAGSTGPAGTYRAETPIDWRNLPPLPGALRAALAAPERPAEPPRYAANGASHEWGQAALAGELGRLLAAPVGQRNETLNRCAFRLAQAAAGGMLDGAEAQARLRAAALGIGLEPAEVDATIASGWAAGSASPRGPDPRHGAKHGAAGGKEAPPEGPQPLLREIPPPARLILPKRSARCARRWKRCKARRKRRWRFRRHLRWPWHRWRCKASRTLKPWAGGGRLAFSC
jgi:putative DNA primase/helicase